jgi:hypothetical protein
MEWIKERVLEFSEEGSTKRIHCRFRSDGRMFYQQLSDYRHTLPFENQRDRLESHFARFIDEPPSTEQYTLADFDQDFEERLGLMKAKEVFPAEEAAA